MAPPSPDSGTPPDGTGGSAYLNTARLLVEARRLVFTPRASYILPVDECILPLLPLPIVLCPGTARPSGHADGVHSGFARPVRAPS